MVFNSFEYLLFFLPLMLLLYYGFTRKNPVASNTLILVGSYIFYGWNEPWFLLLLAVSSVVDFYLGLAIHRAPTPRLRKRYLIFSIAANLTLLGIFKYANWVSGMLHSVIPAVPVLAIALPSGISFYTFQSLSYIFDLYLKRIQPTKRLLDYLAFVSFFPHLVAGPILRARQVLPQLERIRPRVHPKIAERALFMIAWGLFKKMVCADNLGLIVEMCSQNLDKPGIGLVMCFAFAFQVYFDFSAYSDIARGSARLFGVYIPPNFLNPFFSTNPTIFWRRWHISLSGWVRDYVFPALGGARKGRNRAYLNLLISMALVGLWHGASGQYVLWGIYHGLFIVLYMAVPIDRWLMKLPFRIGDALCMMLMTTIFAASAPLFFTSDWSVSWAMVKSTLATFGSEPLPDLFYHMLWGTYLFTALIIVTDMIGFWKKREFVELYLMWPLWVRVLLFVFVFYALVFFAARESYDFVYFQF